MKRTTPALLLGAVFAALASAPPERLAGSAAEAALSLPGTTWHTARLDGDSLFFLVEEVGLRFEADGRFAARVKFIDGQRATRTGTYRIDGGTIFVAITGVAKPKEIQYWADGADLIIRDQAFDVTARLAPGQMEESWF